MINVINNVVSIVMMFALVAAITVAVAIWNIDIRVAALLFLSAVCFAISEWMQSIKRKQARERQRREYELTRLEWEDFAKNH